MLGADTFLLNPHNRPFVEGRANRPANLATLPGCMLLFILPFLFAGAFTLAFALNEWYSVIGFAAAARPAEATITDKGIVPDDEGDDDPYLNYSYSVGEADGGGRFRGKASVSWDDYAAFEPEDTLQIEYIAYSPERSRMVGTHNHRNMAGFMTIFTLIWNLIVVSISYFVISNRIKSSRLKRDGQLVRGTLVGYETSTDSDNDLWVKVSYSFHSPAGQLIRGQEQRMDNALKGTPEPPLGTPVAVLYVDEKTHTML